jgi:serine/threonine protein kinase
MTAAASRPAPPLVGTSIFDQFRVMSLHTSNGVCDRYLVRPVEGGAMAQARVFVHPAFARGAEALWDAIEPSIQRLGAVEHPNVQRLLSAGVIDTHGESRLCLVTEFNEGDSIETRAHGDRRIPLLDTLSIGQRVLHGLAAIHQLGLVHGDLRPGNVRFARGGAAGDALSWPVLCDVAIGNLLLDAMGRPPSLRDLVFSAEALSPEQIEGEPATVASDIYSMGTLLYRMMTGTAPFLADDDSELLVAQLSEEPRSLHDAGIEAPPALEALVRRCLAKSPDERFESTVALVRALRDCEQALSSPGKSANGGRSFFGAGGSTPLENKRPSQPAPHESGLHTPRTSSPPVKPADASSQRAVLTAAEAERAVSSPPRASPLRASTLPPAPFARTRSSAPPPPAVDSAPRVSLASYPALSPAPLPEPEAPRDVSRVVRWMTLAVAVTFGLVVFAAGALIQARRERLHTAVATLLPPRIPTNVRFTIRTNVEGARAIVRGASHTLPIRLEVAAGAVPEILEVSAEGYTPRRMWVVLDSNTEVQVELNRPTNAPAAPAVAPTETTAERRRRERRERDLARRGIRVLTAEEAAVQAEAVGRAEPITGEAIQRAVRLHRGEVNECVRRARLTTPSLGGRIAVSIVLTPAGLVRNASWNGNNPTQREAALCVADAIRRWEFPPTGASGDLHVVYPFSLR